ncbi:MAG: BrnT family toxin, partial [Rhizobiaceae bacterium]
MRDDEFEWDERKAESNFAKHGVTFEMACGAFRDVFAVEFLDERAIYSEERLNLIGMYDG